MALLKNADVAVTLVAVMFAVTARLPPTPRFPAMLDGFVLVTFNVPVIVAAPPIVVLAPTLKLPYTLALVAAELVGANSGLGFLINDARTVLRTDYILVGMLAIGVIGLCLDRLIRYTAQKLMPWSRALNA